jgi:uncharacterized membrane protein YjjB (DUF3815 family)
MKHLLAYAVASSILAYLAGIWALLRKTPHTAQ